MAELSTLSEEDFLDSISAVAHNVFDCSTHPREPLTTEAWKLLVEAGVFLPSLPRRFGGRESHREMVQVLERIAEWNLPVAFYAKITTAVALRPIIAWGTEQTQQEVLSEFAAGEPITCGLALTEPERGTSLSGMTTTFEKVDGGYRIRGRKHWQGFSSTARWWIVCGKEKGGNTFGFFVVRRDEGFETVESYDPIGMRAIDYGVNVIDAIVPEHRRLKTYDGDLSAVVEVLMSPRSLMPAMGAGFLRRIEREARTHTASRAYGRSTLDDVPFVRYRLDSITASSTICRALEHHVLTRLDFRGVMLPAYPQVQAIKTVATESMISAANHYLQLSGGDGYRQGSPTNIAAQAFMDSRVFTIFDGTNDLLSQQLAQHCGGLQDGSTLSSFLAGWPSTERAVRHLGIDLTFLDGRLGQAQLVLAGRTIAYLVAVGFVMGWGEETTDGADDVADLVTGAIASLRADIRRTAAELQLVAELPSTRRTPVPV